MKRVLVGSLVAAAIAAVTGSAMAADLMRRPVQAPAPVPAYSPVYNWTGPYIGINGGAGWGSSSFDGVAVGVPATGGFSTSGWLFGGTAGYNWQMNQVVFGLEGDIDWANIGGSQTATAACFGLTCSTSDSWLGTVRGRVGWAFDRFLPYVTGGLAFGDIRASGPFGSATGTNAGWTVGGGVEYGITQNWSLKAEYLYVDLGSINCGVACRGIASDPVNFRTNIVRGGLNYRF